MSYQVTDIPPVYMCTVCDFCGLRSDSTLAKKRQILTWHVRVYDGVAPVYDYCSITCMRKDCARRTGTIHCESKITGLVEPRCHRCDCVA